MEKDKLCDSEGKNESALGTSIQKGNLTQHTRQPAQTNSQNKNRGGQTVTPFAQMVSDKRKRKNKLLTVIFFFYLIVSSLVLLKSGMQEIILSTSSKVSFIYLYEPGTVG